MCSAREHLPNLLSLLCLMHDILLPLGLHLVVLELLLQLRDAQLLWRYHAALLLLGVLQ